MNKFSEDLYAWFFGRSFFQVLIDIVGIFFAMINALIGAGNTLYWVIVAIWAVMMAHDFRRYRRRVSQKAN